MKLIDKILRINYKRNVDVNVTDISNESKAKIKIADDIMINANNDLASAFEKENIHCIGINITVSVLIPVNDGANTKFYKYNINSKVTGD